VIEAAYQQRTRAQLIELRGTPGDTTRSP
jgi:hypothetical protein